MLIVEGLSSLPHLRPVSFALEKGKIYGLIGPNGAGKTTLLKALKKIIPQTSGQVTYNGKNLSLASPEELSQVLTLVPQHPIVNFPFSVEEFIAMGGYSHQNRKEIGSVLQEFDLFSLKNRALTALSGGERQRAYLARAFVTEAPYLLLDEPASYLDLSHEIKLWASLESLRSQGRSIVVALHSLEKALFKTDSLLVLSQGTLHKKGPPKETLTEELLVKIFGLKIAEAKSYLADKCQRELL